MLTFSLSRLRVLRFIAFFTLFCGTAAPLIADDHLELPSVLASHMVFQQRRSITIWGKAGSRQTVTVVLRSGAGQQMERQQTIPGLDGDWSVSLAPRTASFQTYAIHITQGRQSILLSDVLVGEVWVAAGQSNMQLSLPYILGGDRLVHQASNPYIRNFCERHLPAGPPFKVTPQFDVVDGQWLVADKPEGLTRGDVSGIGYTFALALFDFFKAQGKKVPIAILNTATGSTGIRSWLPAIPGEQQKPSADKQGFDSPVVEFQNKIAPLTRLEIRGVLWYQGENNVSTEAAAQTYAADLRKLVLAWRRAFHAPDSPFLVVELASYPKQEDHPFDEAAFRQAQIAGAAAVPNALAVPIYDISMQWNIGPFEYKAPIHPLDKAPVGRRLAQVAEHMVYSEAPRSIVSTLSHCEEKGSNVELRFSSSGGSLSTFGDAPLRGFKVAGPDGVFHDVQAVLKKNAVDVTLRAFKDQQRLSYAYANNNNAANLANAYDIPVNPFYLSLEPERRQAFMRLGRLQTVICSSASVVTEHPSERQTYLPLVSNSSLTSTLEEK